MLEVLPIQTKEEQKELCARCGVPFRADLLAYRATVDGQFYGISQFTMDADGGRIADFAWLADKPYDFESLLILGRATLNFIDLCGVHKAFFDAECPNETLIKAIGFTKNQAGRWEIDLTDFFIDHCKGHK